MVGWPLLGEATSLGCSSSKSNKSLTFQFVSSIDFDSTADRAWFLKPSKGTRALVTIAQTGKDSWAMDNTMLCFEKLYYLATVAA